MKPGPTRRALIQRTTEAAAVLTAASTLGVVHGVAAEKPATLRLGIIGCGGMMGGHVKGLVGRREEVSFAWLCDVDPGQIEKTAGLIEGFQSASPKRTARFEDVIEDKDVDACIIATPHHWHAPIALRAMREGKDLYIEKPISHVYDEGPKIIAAARKYGRVVQQGSQMRSSPVTEEAGRLLKDGIIGEVKLARAWTAEPRSVLKPRPDGAPPSGRRLRPLARPRARAPVQPQPLPRHLADVPRLRQRRDRRRRHPRHRHGRLGAGRRHPPEAGHRARGADVAARQRRRLPRQPERDLRIPRWPPPGV